MTTLNRKLITNLTKAGLDDVCERAEAMSQRWQNDHGISQEHADFMLAGALVVAAGYAARAAYHSAPEERRFRAMEFLLMRFAEASGVDMLDIREKEEEISETVGTA